MEVLAKASGKAERTDNCNYARKQFFPREEIKEGVSKVKAARPEGAEAHSPGQRPEVKSHQKQCAL